MPLFRKALELNRIVGARLLGRKGRVTESFNFVAAFSWYVIVRHLISRSKTAPTLESFGRT